MNLSFSHYQNTLVINMKINKKMNYYSPGSCLVTDESYKAADLSERLPSLSLRVLLLFFSFYLLFFNLLNAFICLLLSL